MTTYDKENDLRYEMKYEISKAEAKCLLIRLKSCMKLDHHAEENGMYRIRSLYYDTYGDDFLQANLDGVEPRNKWRIRTYDLSEDTSFLECKSKIRGLIRKDSCMIKREDFDTFDKEFRTDAGAESSLINRFILLKKEKDLTPKVIVQYDRIPFVYPAGNVRITIDYNIMSSTDTDGLFCPSIRMRPVLDTGRCLLEVKWTGILPDHIRHMLGGLDMRWSTFSKYCICRRYN